MTLTIQVLIDNHAQVDAQNSNGETPFHYAALKDNIIAAEKMISRANYKVFYILNILKCFLIEKLINS